MRVPLASLAAAVLLLGAANYQPVEHRADLIDVCAAARANLAGVETDLGVAVKAAAGLTTTVDELTRRLGLGNLLGSDATDNSDAIAKIRAVVTLKAAKALAVDRVHHDCTGHSTSTSPSATPTPTIHYPDSGIRRPRRAPETGGGPA
jgi:hypothetical protein